MIRRDRLNGVDAARTLAGVLVIFFHCLDHYALLGLVGGAKVAWPIAVSCVDLFALLSGYLGLRSTFKPSKIVGLWVQVVFTGAVVVLCGRFLGGWSMGLKDLLKVALPIMGNEYWYFTQYFFLFFLMPFFNLGLNNLSRRSLMIVLGALIVFGVVLPAVNPSCGDTFRMSNGFSCLWLSVCYLVGGMMRRVEGETTARRGRRALSWLVAVVVVAAIAALVRLPGKCFYNSPFVLAIAVCLFMACLRFRFSAAWIKRMLAWTAPCSFGAYLWLCQPLLLDRMTGMLKFVNDYPALFAVGVLFAFSALSFAFVCVIEHARMQLFRLVKIDKLVKTIDNFVTKGMK